MMSAAAYVTGCLDELIFGDVSINLPDNFDEQYGDAGDTELYVDDEASSSESEEEDEALSPPGRFPARRVWSLEEFDTSFQPFYETNQQGGHSEEKCDTKVILNEDGAVLSRLSQTQIDAAFQPIYRIDEDEQSEETGDIPTIVNEDKVPKLTRSRNRNKGKKVQSKTKAESSGSKYPQPMIQQENFSMLKNEDNFDLDLLSIIELTKAVEKRRVPSSTRNWESIPSSRGFAKRNFSNVKEEDRIVLLPSRRKNSSASVNAIMEGQTLLQSQQQQHLGTLSRFKDKFTKQTRMRSASVPNVA